MKPKDPDANVLLPALERIAVALEKIDSRLEDLGRFEKTARWYDQYLKLTTAVSDDSVATMKTGVLEAVPLHYLNEMQGKFEKAPAELELWYRKAVFFQRIYEYLFATIAYSDWSRVLFEEDKSQRLKLLAGLRDEEHAVLRWTQELVRDPDFQMVHIRQSQYYPKFALIIDRVLDHAAKDAEDRGESEIAADLKTIRDWAQTEKKFEEFRNRDESDPEHRRIREFLTSKRLNPNVKEHFRRAWARFPDFREGSYDTH